MPRGMTLKIAAAYVGLSQRKFREGVRRGRFPKANEDGVWDRKALDACFDEEQPLVRQSDPYRRRAGELHGSHHTKVR